MPLFEIVKPITATLRVECNSQEEALIWSEKIVATLEDENGNIVFQNEIISFEAETINSTIEISETTDILM